MPIICPTITAYDTQGYRSQMEMIKSFARRIHIDLMDGEFAPAKSIDLENLWWPSAIKADLHLMYKRPMDYLEKIVGQIPNLVIIHAEAEVHHMHFAAEMHKRGINTGLAIKPETSIASVEQILHSFDHLMIFSGNLGRQGGSRADMSLLHKVEQAKKHHPGLEIGWDGGINDQNVRQLAEGGIDVLSVGGFIQKANDPQIQYKELVDLI